MKLFENNDDNVNADNSSSGFDYTNASEVFARDFKGMEPAEILNEYVEALRNDNLDEMMKKYDLNETQIIALDSSAKLMVIFAVWEDNNGKPSDEVLKVITSVFDESDAKQTVSLLLTLSFYTWQFTKNMSGED